MVQYGDAEWRDAVLAWVQSPAFKTFNPSAQVRTAPFQTIEVYQRSFPCNIALCSSLVPRLIHLVTSAFFRRPPSRARWPG